MDQVCSVATSLTLIWSIQWWNTLIGKPVSADEVSAVHGSLQIEVPTFQADIAGHLKKCLPP
jgi:hypothetical protein